MKTVAALFCTSALLALAACASAPGNPNPRAAVPQQLASVDLPRYMGVWYNIAHVPYFGERDYVGSYSIWTLRPDGQIDDVFAGKKGGFDAPESRRSFVDTVEPDSHGAHWHVHLLGPITVSQLTLFVDADYRYTILGYPDKSLAWIFARTPEVNDKDYEALLAKLDAQGYDTTRLLRVPQQPADLGRPGYLTIDH